MVPTALCPTLDNKSERGEGCLDPEKGEAHTLYNVQWFSMTKEVQINGLVVYGCSVRAFN